MKSIRVTTINLFHTHNTLRCTLIDKYAFVSKGMVKHELCIKYTKANFVLSITHRHKTYYRGLLDNFMELDQGTLNHGLCGIRPHQYPSPLQEQGKIILKIKRDIIYSVCALSLVDSLRARTR